MQFNIRLLSILALCVVESMTPGWQVAVHWLGAVELPPALRLEIALVRVRSPPVGRWGNPDCRKGIHFGLEPTHVHIVHSVSSAQLINQVAQLFYSLLEQHQYRQPNSGMGL
jgi:hypothetical protein